MLNWIIGIVVSLVGGLLLALKVKSDEVNVLQTELNKLKDATTLQPLNEQLVQVQQEVKNAEKVYDKLVPSSNSNN